MPFCNNTQANLGDFLKWTSEFGCLIPIKLTVSGACVSLGCLISVSQRAERDFIPKQMMDLENQEFCCCLFPPLLLPVNSSRLVPLVPILLYVLGSLWSLFQKNVNWTHEQNSGFFLSCHPSSLSCEEQQSQTFSLWFFFFFFFLQFLCICRSGWNKGGSISCSWHWAKMCTLMSLYLLHTG